MKRPVASALWMPVIAVIASLLAAPLQAQFPTRANMPEEIVLVVRVIGEETVEPVTGVVIGRDDQNRGLVVVPASFVDATGDLFVLDGGTNLWRDGRPARRIARDTDEALAVIAVDGLRRPAIAITFNPPEQDHELRLAAWPSADKMAEGALPYWVPVGIAGTLPEQPQSMLPDQDMPNVTGPLIDLCGQWAGMALAAPGDDPETGQEAGPTILLNDQLLGIVRLMELRVRVTACEQYAPVGGKIVPVVPAPPGSTRDAGTGGFIDGLLSDAEFGLGAILFLLSAITSGIVFWIIIQRRAAAQKRKRIRRTLQTETVNFSSGGLPTRQTRVDPPSTFAPETAPTGTREWLRIEGHHADGRPLRAVTSIDSSKFQAVIGRAGVQLAADGPGISRRHAVVMGEDGKLLISDLGSRNGTFVNGVRCQKDEIFLLKEGDKILLGAAEVTLRMSPIGGASS